ncbi:MAG: hypothetical protein ACKV0T_08900 [Planctomycetales bacterium]
MSHSHLALQHLIRKIESPESLRKRFTGPDWLPGFVDQVAELFEPFVDTARVGFECAPGDERWEVSMYLGGTELVGGRNDGEVRPVPFQFNLAQLNTILTDVEELSWNVFPAGALSEAAPGHDRSFMAVTGKYADQFVRLRIYGTAPHEAGPGLRRFPDGTVEPVERVG